MLIFPNPFKMVKAAWPRTSASPQAIQVFPCSNCNETINTSMQQCTFCSAPIDPVAAQHAAEKTAKISQACSDASYLKIMVGCALTFFVARFSPFLTLSGFAGFTFLEIAIPVIVIRWWLKYCSIETNDPDFTQAKLSASYVGGGALLFLLFVLTGRVAVHALGFEFNSVQ